MSTTTLIAKIVSVYFIVTGLGFIFSSEFYSTMIAHTGTDPVLINLSGMVHFFIGMTILVNHFLWKKPFQIVVTLLGFMFLLKGVFLIALPELTLQTSNNPAQVPWIMALGFIAVGITIGYFAYFTKQVSSIEKKSNL
ncbi:MAG: hypothetical protein ABFQ65_04780 [Nanoarchaeota archaeon]